MALPTHEISRIKPLTNLVKVIEVCQVSPAASDSLESAKQFVLPLTYFDIAWLKFPPSECLYFFELNDSSGSPSSFYSTVLPRLKRSLSQTLIPYFLLAGQLTWPANSSKPLIVYSPNDAISLTIAESNEDFEHFIGNEIQAAVESHPYIPELAVSSTMASLVALQITLFPHKGYSIGTAMHHAFLDAKSASMFMNTWAYISKQGGTLCSLPEGLTPFLDRTVIHDSAGLETPYLNQWATTKVPGTEWNPRSLELLPTFELPENMLRATFHLSLDAINKLKESVMLYHQTRSHGTKLQLLHFSTYVVVCAYVSVCLVKARGGDRDRKAYLVWMADCRNRLTPVPQNYFGNCVLVNHLVADAETFMAENGVAIIAEKLSGLIKGLEKGLFDGAKERLAMLRGLPPEVQQFGVGGSNRTGFYNLDFGWGRVRRVSIISLDRTGGFSIMETNRDGGEGIEIGVALTKLEMKSFALMFGNGLEVSRSDQ